MSTMQLHNATYCIYRSSLSHSNHLILQWYQTSQLLSKKSNQLMTGLHHTTLQYIMGAKIFHHNLIIREYLQI